MDTQEKVLALSAAEPFRLLDADARADFAALMTVRNATFGDEIFERGAVGDAMYVVVEGKARVIGQTSGGEETTLAVLNAGKWFGETALTTDTRRNATVRAASDLRLLRLDREHFQRLCRTHPAVGESLAHVLAFHEVHNFLKQTTAFGRLPSELVRKTIGAMRRVEVGAGEIVAKAGEFDATMFIVGRGTFDVAPSDAGRSFGQIGEGELFGDASPGERTRATSVTARTAGFLYALDQAAVVALAAESPELSIAIADLAAHRGDVVDGDLPSAAEPAVGTRSLAAPDAAAGEEPIPAAKRRWFKRYPHLPQHDESDCAAACLAMITKYYNAPANIARLREIANVDADGATMLSVARAAEALGFHSRGYQLSYEALEEVALPAIAHWEGRHYIVIYEADADGVLVADPAADLARVDRETFLKGWKGRLLELTPTDRLRVSDDPPQPHRLWRLMRPHAPLLLEVLGASLALSVLGLGFPMFTQVIIDRVLVSRAPDLLNMIFIGMLAIVAFHTVLSVVRRVLLIHVSTRADARLICEFLQHVMSLPMRFFDFRRVGDVLSRVSENDKVREAMISTIPTAIVDVVLMTGYLAILLYYDVKLTLILACVTLPFVVFIVMLTPRIRQNQRLRSATNSAAWSGLIEAITGIATLKAMAAETPFRWKIESNYVDALLADREGAHLQTATSAAAAVLQLLSGTVLLWYGAHQVLAGAMSVGQLLAMSALLAGVIGPMLRLVDAWDQVQSIRNAFERLNDIFDAKPEQESKNPLIHLDRLQGNLRFESVTFRYSPNQEKPALAEFSVDIPAGSTVAVVGRSGSGKSTLAKLLLGLYRPTRGRILIDGHDLKVVSKPTLRRRIGVVPQDVFLFSGTVHENIAGGMTDVPPDRVIRAAKNAGAHDFITALGLGYETRVGERGSSLSGGQRQRIALARAILNDPAILVLDEATSALDTESERVIQKNLEAAHDRTTIVIAHRLSTVMRADRILVLDAGTLVEQGTHDQLIRRGGLYAHLAGQQLNQ